MGDWLGPFAIDNARGGGGGRISPFMLKLVTPERKGLPLQQALSSRAFQLAATVGKHDGKRIETGSDVP